MRTTTRMGTAIAAALAAATIGLAAPAVAQPYGYGPGMMGGYGQGYAYGPGMMGGYGYGPGMMGGYGPGMMGGGYGYGPGMMRGYGYGPGMMRGYGYGPGMMGYGPGGYGNRGDLNLSADDVKTRFERWIEAQGNPHIKVGGVKQTDDNTVQVDIVTKDKDALVQRFEVNRHTGFYRPSQG